MVEPRLKTLEELIGNMYVRLEAVEGRLSKDYLHDLREDAEMLERRVRAARKALPS